MDKRVLLVLALLVWGVGAKGFCEDRAMENKNKPMALTDAQIRQKLTPEEYHVMRENGTEPAFLNAYWNNEKAGIYVDRLSGTPLFSSKDKFESGTGWPSFVRPIVPDAVVQKNDASFGMERTEVRSAVSGSHLGHVFHDGPPPTGLRYCMNSASLRFIPAEDLVKDGYAQYAPLFGHDPAKPRTQIAVFGAGCFWGVEAAFRGIKGVVGTTVGFMGGTTKNPTYEQVCTHTTGHAEVVQVEYDPGQVSYEKLLDVFWKIHDPTTSDRQGPDVGSQYRSVIFTTTPEQKKAAELSKARLESSGEFKNPIVTQIEPAAAFYKAEEYHQRYYEKHGMQPTCHIA